MSDRPADELEMPLNCEAGQIKLGARDVIAEEAFTDRPRFVGDLDISNRLLHALEFARIFTIAELTRMTEREVSRVKGIGVRTLGELRAVLGRFGLKMREPGRGFHPKQLERIERAQRELERYL